MPQYCHNAKAVITSAQSNPTVNTHSRYLPSTSPTPPPTPPPTPSGLYKLLIICMRVLLWFPQHAFTSFTYKTIVLLQNVDIAVNAVLEI